MCGNEGDSDDTELLERLKRTNIIKGSVPRGYSPGGMYKVPGYFFKEFPPAGAIIVWEDEDEGFLASWHRRRHA